MYEQVFNFTSRPFTAAPYVKHYFAGEAIQNALEQTRLNVDRGAGPVVVVGATGTGKTLLLAILEASYRDQITVVNLACARLQERKDLLQSILHRLQLPFQGLSETELRFALMDYLEPNPNCVNGIVLLVDDAHSLPAGLLDELGLLTNFVAEGQPRVRLVLAGSHRLEENLNEAKLDSLNQRIASRCYLENMSRSEASRYVVEHIARVGGNGEKLFPETACRAIHEATDGYPRLINQVADHALMLAATRGISEITEDCVREAWADVQSIPATFQPQMPAISEPGDLSSDENWSVLEFGQLDDGDGDDAGVGIFPPEANNASIQYPSAETSSAANIEAETDSSQADTEPSDGDLLPMGSDFDSAIGGANINSLEREQAQIFEQVERKRMEIFEAEEPVHVLGSQAQHREPMEEVSQPSDLEAREVEIAPATDEEVRQNQEVVDPFQEKFAEEEVLGDYFTPMVARQNQASLSIRSVDLTDLTPEDTPDVGQAVNESPQDPLVELRSHATPESGQDFEVEQRSPVETKYFEPDPSRDTVEARDQQVGEETAAMPEVPSGYEFMMGTDWTSTSATPSIENPVPAPETIPESSGDGFHVHGDNVVSTDIRKQAEEILGRLSSADSSSGEQLSGSTVAKEALAPANEAAELSDIESVSNYPSAALDESQQILNEILEQRNALAQQAEPGDGAAHVEEAAPKAQMQVFEKEQENEKPIIVVNQAEDATEEKPPAVEPPVPPTAPTSTGRAERMDYQKLFEQLRDISNSQNS